MSASNPMFSELPHYRVGAGVQTNLGTLLNYGARVTYVCSAPGNFATSFQIGGRILPTLAQGLAECRSGMGDVVVILPGHTESVTDTTMMANLEAGTRIMSLVDPWRTDAPTFTWTATTAAWNITVANVEIIGLRLLVDGVNNVAAPIKFSAASGGLLGNWIRTSSGASNKATVAVTVDTGATDFRFNGNYVTGDAAGACTDIVLLQGATVPSRFMAFGNNMMCASSTTNGLIRVSVAALNTFVANNTLFNLTASSVAAVNYGNVACTGVIQDNRIMVRNTGAVTSGTTGITLGAAAVINGFNNLVANDPRTSGLLLPTVDT